MFHTVKSVVARAQLSLVFDALGVMSLGLMLYGALHLPSL